MTKLLFYSIASYLNAPKSTHRPIGKTIIIRLNMCAGTQNRLNSTNVLSFRCTFSLILLSKFDNFVSHESPLCYTSAFFSSRSIFYSSKTSSSVSSSKFDALTSDPISSSYLSILFPPTLVSSFRLSKSVISSVVSDDVL